MQSSNILGIILARGGSKRLPRKNIASLNGKPLLAYTCEAALGSKLLTRVILSTDNEDIAAIGRQYGVEVPFMRPAQLATDKADSMDVLRHVLQELEQREHCTPSLVVLLQPTSPLRTSAHIDAGIGLLQQTGADSVVSVTEVPHLPCPPLAMRIRDGRLTKGSPQTPEKCYAYNGAVYVLRSERLKQPGNPYGDNCRPLIMDPADSLDIDTDSDLELAELLLKRKKS